MKIRFLQASVILAAGLFVGSANAEIAGGDEVVHTRADVAGIDLKIGNGSGIASCGPEQIYLESTELHQGIYRIRVFFPNFVAEVDQSLLARRLTCMIRLREAHQQGTKLRFLGGSVQGHAAVMKPGVRAGIGLSIASLGHELSLDRIVVGRDGYFVKSLSVQSDQPVCASTNIQGLFSISLAASLQTQMRQEASLSVERLDFYVREEACQ